MYDPLKRRNVLQHDPGSREDSHKDGCKCCDQRRRYHGHTQRRIVSSAETMRFVDIYNMKGTLGTHGEDEEDEEDEEVVCGEAAADVAIVYTEPAKDVMSPAPLDASVMASPPAEVMTVITCPSKATKVCMSQ